MRYRLILGLALALVVLDQGSKWLVARHLPPHESIVVTGFFNLVHVYNFGAAFGFLNDPGSSWQRWLFLGATAAAVGMIFFVARGAGERERALFCALGLILGGALGNCVDRLRMGAVLDFLDFHYAGWHWPAFNVADMAICGGAGLLALLILSTRKANPQT